jgi:hypothetical protein
MSKRKSYSVEGVCDENGRWTLRDSCVNRDLPSVGDVCAHLRAFTVVFDRINRGFETVVFGDLGLPLYPAASADCARLASNIEALGERLDAERLIIRAAAKRQAEEDPVLFRESKFFHLKHVVRVRSLQMVNRPITVVPRAVHPSVLVNHLLKRKKWEKKLKASSEKSKRAKSTSGARGRGNQPTMEKEHDTRKKRNWIKKHDWFNRMNHTCNAHKSTHDVADALCDEEKSFLTDFSTACDYVSSEIGRDAQAERIADAAKHA